MLAPSPGAAAGARRIGVVLKGYPRLSETFIAQELAALERRGLALALFSLRRPTDGAVHPVHREITAPELPRARPPKTNRSGTRRTPAIVR